MESGAYSRFGINGNVSSITFYDAVHHRQAHTRAFSLFGGEIGFKYPFHDLRGHAMTGVTDAQLLIRTVFQVNTTDGAVFPGIPFSAPGEADLPVFASPPLLASGR